MISQSRRRKKGGGEGKKSAHASMNSKKEAPITDLQSFFSN